MAIKKVRMKPPGYTDIVHPETSADVVIEDASHRFVTDSEKGIWNAKQAAITGGATTITSSNLTASRALVSDASGKVTVSAVTSSQLGYLSGATGNIQTQMNLKLERNNDVGSGTGVGTLTIADANLLQGFPASHFATYDEHLLAKSEAENGIADLQYELGLSNTKIGLGGVVESGANANGSYVKYGDGTMIVRHIMSSSNSDHSLWTYPISFTSSPQISGITTQEILLPYILQCWAWNSTLFYFNTVNTGGARVATSVQLVAVGRWKA